MMLKDWVRRNTRTTRVAWRPALIVGLTLALLVIASPVLAIPPVAHVFWGAVKINGQNVPNGTLITAYVMDGEQQVICGQTRSLTTGSPEVSVYSMGVNGEDTDEPGRDGALPGELVRFLIGEGAGQTPANESFAWESARSTNLNLTAGAVGPATPTPTSPGPTATRTATPTHTATPVVSPTHTATPSPTRTPAATQVATATATPTYALTTVNLRRGEGSYDGVTDTYLDLGNVNKNFGGSAGLYLKTIDNVTALLRFDVASPWIPAGAQVASATLRMSYISRTPVTGNVPITLRAYRVQKSWAEMEATWQQASNGVVWSQAGCKLAGSDFDPVADGEWVCYGDGASAPGLALDVTDSVQYWLDHPDKNYGIVVKADSCRTLTALYQFASSNHSTVGMRPVLSVSYFIPLPTPTPTQTATITQTPTITLTPTPTSTVGEIRGYAFFDLDADGYRATDEPTVGNIVIQLYRGGVLIDSYTTLNDGRYAFTGLQQDTYGLRQVEVPGYISTTGENWILPVQAGHTHYVDFGLWLALSPTPTRVPGYTYILPLMLKQH